MNMTLEQVNLTAEKLDGVVIETKTGVLNGNFVASMLREYAAHLALTAVLHNRPAQERAEPVAEMTPEEKCRQIQENRDYWYVVAEELRQKLYDATNTAPPAERVREPDWQHIANELADATCNGIQWLRNVRDGVSSADDAIAEMTENYHRIQALSAAPEADHD